MRKVWVNLTGTTLLLLIICTVPSCSSKPDKSNIVATSDTSAKKITPPKQVNTPSSRKIDFRKLIGAWLQCDSLYEGSISDPGLLLKDSLLWQKKRERLRGKCDGGCIYAWRFDTDGHLTSREDDTGHSYRYLIDPLHDAIILCRKPTHAPADTVGNYAITFLDDKYLMVVSHVTIKGDKRAITRIFTRTNKNYLF